MQYINDEEIAACLTEAAARSKSIDIKYHYYLRVEPMILLKLAREAAIPGRSEGGIALKCTTKYLPPTGPIDLRPGGAVPKPCPPKKSPRAFFVQNQ